MNTNKVIINAAITGGILSKKDNPYLPVTVIEILDCVRLCYDEGVSIVHLHARDANQKPTTDASVYAELVGRIREICPDLIVCVSLSGRQGDNEEDRLAALTARPDMASLSLGSMNFPTQPSINSPDTIVKLAANIRAAGAIPELEVFEAGFAHYAKHLIKRGVLAAPYYFNIILGSLGAAPLDLTGLGHILSLLPEGAVWSAGGIGQYQLDANVMSLAAGGHIRVGLEDTVYFDRDKTEHADNPRLIRRIVHIARLMGREPTSPLEARRMIGLPSTIQRDQR